MAATEDSGEEHSDGLLASKTDVAGVSVALDESPGGTVECTLYPTDADEEELVTTWLTAGEDAFVSLDETR